MENEPLNVVNGESTTKTILIALGVPVIILFLIFISIKGFQSQKVVELGCEGYKSSKQIDCYHEQAVKENSFAICEKINGADNIREGCLKEIWGMLEQSGRTIDPSECNTLDGHQKTMCYWDVAGKFQDPKICSGIDEDDLLRNNCINWVNRDIVSSCNQNKECYWEKIAKTGASLCEYEGFSLNDKIACYVEANKTIKDESLCTKAAEVKCFLNSMSGSGGYAVPDSFVGSCKDAKTKDLYVTFCKSGKVF